MQLLWFKHATHLPIPSCLAQLALHIFAFHGLAVPLEQHRRAETVEEATTTMTLPATTKRLAFCTDRGLNEIRSIARRFVAKRARKPPGGVKTSAANVGSDRVATAPVTRCEV